MHIHCVVVACRFLLYRIGEQQQQQGERREMHFAIANDSRTTWSRLSRPRRLSVWPCNDRGQKSSGLVCLSSLFLSLSHLFLFCSLFFFLLLLLVAVHISILIPVPVPVPVLISLHLKPSRVFTPFAPHCVLRPDCLSLSISLALCLSFTACFSLSCSVECRHWQWSAAHARHNQIQITLHLWDLNKNLVLLGSCCCCCCRCCCCSIVVIAVAVDCCCCCCCCGLLLPLTLIVAAGALLKY